MMKVCPVCKSLSFDDAEVCYGCLHQFAAEDASSKRGDDASLHAPRQVHPKEEQTVLASHSAPDSEGDSLAPSGALEVAEHRAHPESLRDTSMTVSNPCRIVLSTSKDGTCMTISIEAHTLQQTAERQ